jgi:putative transposase
MNEALFPLRFLLVAAALWLSRQQREVIDYLKAENRLLKEKLGNRRIHFTDAERQRLAIVADALGRKALAQLDALVTPDTLLRWHRELVARKWNFAHRRGVGRPCTKDEIVALILRIVRDNPSGVIRVSWVL